MSKSDNLVLLILKEHIINLIEKDSSFSKFLIQNGISTPGINEELSRRNSEEIFDKYIANLSTEKFLKILSNFDEKKLKCLNDAIKDHSSEFLIKLKDEAFQNISVIDCFSIHKTKKNFREYAEILCPINFQHFSQTLYKQEKVELGTEILLHEHILKNKKILILGETGIGKTFNCLTIYYNWARNKILTDFFIFYIDLFKINPNSNLIDVILEQNFVNFNEYDRIFLRYLIKEKSDRVILLFDGVDALNSPDSIFHKIIYENQSIDYRIVVWMRENTTDEFQEMYNEIFKIDGFNSKDIRCFFRTYFSSCQVADNILSYLQLKRKALLESCTNPLIAYLVCSLWQCDGILESTQSEIVEKSVNIFLGENLIPNSERYKNIFTILGERAFDHLVDRQKMIISESSIDLDYLNGIISYKYSNKEKLEREFKFCNKIFYEYIIAKYLIIKFEENEKILTDEIIKKILLSPDKFHFKQIFQFIFDLNTEMFCLLPNCLTKTIIDSKSNYQKYLISLMKYNNPEKKLKLKYSFIKEKDTCQIFYQNLSNLVIIDFEDVIFEDITEFLFEISHLSNNNLEKIKIKYNLKFRQNNSEFNSLKTLNNLQRGCKKLKIIYLQNVNYAGTYFQSLQNISEVYLRKCPINFFEISFMKNLKTIDLSHNKIQG